MQVFEDNDHCTKDVPIHHQPAPPSFMMMQVLALLLLCIVPRTQAYASWLKCFVDLDDSEVVMYVVQVRCTESPSFDARLAKAVSAVSLAGRRLMAHGGLM